MSVWDEFDKNIDTKQLQKDIDERKNGDFREVPNGTYHVRVKKMEATTAKSSGNPMVSIQFQITEGEYKKSVLFYHQVIHMAVGIANCNDFLRSMELECVDDLEPHPFQSYGQYAQLIMDAAEEIDDAGLTFELEYPGKDAWANEWKITEVFES